MKNKSIYRIIFAAILLMVNTSITFAQTGYQGYAIYRDGVLGSINWHGGILYEQSYVPYLKPIIHINGSNYHVAFTEYSSNTNKDNFLKGSDFKDNKLMGIYNKSSIPSYTYDYIRNTAAELTTEMIAYTFLDLLTFSSSGTYIAPHQINKMRCDGVVEYAYEWNNVQVGHGFDVYYGPWWDISKVSENNFHSAFTGPKQQTGFLNKVY